MTTVKSPTSTEEVSIVHELNLGEYILFIRSDQSIKITDPSGEPWSYLADNGLHLGREETHRLYISLAEMYKTST